MFRLVRSALTPCLLASKNPVNPKEHKGCSAPMFRGYTLGTIMRSIPSIALVLAKAGPTVFTTHRLPFSKRQRVLMEAIVLREHHRI